MTRTEDELRQRPISSREHASALFARAVSGTFEIMRRSPPGKWWHRRLWEQIQFPTHDVALGRGGAGLHGLRIVFLSDMHAGFYATREDFDRLAPRIAAMEPDIVCLGGDLVATQRAHLEHLDGLLSSLSPALGMFAVPGNHEVFYFDREGTRPSPFGDWYEYLEQRGVRILLNEGVRIERDGSSLWLGGVDDLEQGRPNVESALAGRHADEPAVLLSHHPDLFARNGDHDIDLQLSGHTHGGQVCLAGWAPVTHSRCGYRAGFYRNGSAQLFVGRGTGVSLAPLRIGAPAEVVTIRLMR